MLIVFASLLPTPCTAAPLPGRHRAGQSRHRTTAGVAVEPVMAAGTCGESATTVAGAVLAVRARTRKRHRFAGVRSVRALRHQCSARSAPTSGSSEAPGVHTPPSGSGAGRGSGRLPTGQLDGVEELGGGEADG